VWGWAKRNVVSDAHPPRVPRKRRKVWTGLSFQTFLQRARSDRFFGLWVLEATSGMRRCELAGARRDPLDLPRARLRSMSRGWSWTARWSSRNGKTENAQHLLALDPFTLAALKAHVEMLDRERKELIIGGSLASTEVTYQASGNQGEMARGPASLANPLADHMQKALSPLERASDLHISSGGGI